MPTEPTVPLQPPGPGALDDLVALYAAHGHAIRDQPLAPARIAQRLNAPGLSLAQDARACYADGRLVGWVQVMRGPIQTRLWLWGVVHPERIGRGIGTALVRWGTERARALAQKVPPGRRVALRSALVAADSRALPLFAGQGFRLIHHYQEWGIHLVGPPPAPAVPLGIRIRTALPTDDLTAICWAKSQAWRDHWDYIERPLAQELAQLQALVQAPGFTPEDWFLAYDGEELAGMALCQSRTVKDASTAWVHTLCVRRHWRRRGIGLALLQGAMRAYFMRGQTAVALGVATRQAKGDSSLYKRAGMELWRLWHIVELELRPGIEG